MTILPPGRYFIGDPSYAFSETWDDVLEMIEGLKEPTHPLFAHVTAYGDGLFMGSDGFEYPVDGAMLGAIPVAMIEEGCKPDAEDGVNINAPHGLECNEDCGVFTFRAINVGPTIVIDTQGDPEFDDRDDNSFFKDL